MLFLPQVFLLIALSAQDGFPDPTIEVATVRAIVDGDTIDCDANNKTIRIRLIAIDAPELHQPRIGPDSRAWLRLACPPGSTVILVADSHHPADSYGRPIRWVEFGGVVLNIEAVRAGQAFAYRPPGRRVDRWAEVQAAEAEAILARRGIWGVPGGVTKPWIWRKQAR
jgi:endonuclease YncB( thermonuclease family)